MNDTRIQKVTGNGLVTGFSILSPSRAQARVRARVRRKPVKAVTYRLPVTFQVSGELGVEGMSDEKLFRGTYRKKSSIAVKPLKRDCGARLKIGTSWRCFFLMAAGTVTLQV